MQPSTMNYYVAVSLDGYIAAPDGTFDHFLNDEAFNADMFAKLQTEFDSVVMGRATYEVGVREGVTNPYPWLDTYVVTTTYNDAPDPAVKLLRSIDEVASLKASQTAGRIWLCGGGELASALHARNLIDRLELKRHPVVFGDGIPMFRRRGFDPCQFVPQGEPTRWDSGIEVTAFSASPLS